MLRSENIPSKHIRKRKGDSEIHYLSPQIGFSDPCGLPLSRNENEIEVLSQKTKDIYATWNSIFSIIVSTNNHSTMSRGLLMSSFMTEKN